MQGREGNYKCHSASVDQLCWSPCKPEQLVTASGDKTIRLWDARGQSAQPPLCARSLITSWILEDHEKYTYRYTVDQELFAIVHKHDIFYVNYFHHVK